MGGFGEADQAAVEWQLMGASGSRDWEVLPEAEPAVLEAQWPGDQAEAAAEVERLFLEQQLAESSAAREAAYQQLLGAVSATGGGAGGEAAEAVAALLCQLAAESGGGCGMATAEGARPPPCAAPTTPAAVALQAGGCPSASSVEHFAVEQRWVGLLVGTRGAGIKGIEVMSGAKLSINQATRELGYSVVQLTGSDDQIAKAKDLIIDRLRPGQGLGSSA